MTQAADTMEEDASRSGFATEELEVIDGNKLLTTIATLDVTASLPLQSLLLSVRYPI
jgi:hypothetical protein